MAKPGSDYSSEVTYLTKKRVSDLACAGIPKKTIARIMEISLDTLNKHYDYELDCAKPELVERIGKAVAMQAEAGDHKSQALYLKTQGAKYGWVEKQVIETQNAEDTQALKDKIAELEGKFDKDF